jgi:DNA transposition AAA+ family ATPase
MAVARNKTTTELLEFFRDAQTDALVLAITGNAGSGKTATKKNTKPKQMFGCLVMNIGTANGFA